MKGVTVPMPPAPTLEPLPPPAMTQRLKLKLVNLTEHERIREDNTVTHHWRLEYEVVAQPGYGVWQFVSTHHNASWLHTMLYEAFHRAYDGEWTQLDAEGAAHLWIGREVIGIVHFGEYGGYKGWQLKRIEHPSPGMPRRR